MEPAILRGYKFSKNDLARANCLVSVMNVKSEAKAMGSAIIVLPQLRHQ